MCANGATISLSNTYNAKIAPWPSIYLWKRGINSFVTNSIQSQLGNREKERNATLRKGEHSLLWMTIQAKSQSNCCFKMETDHVETSIMMSIATIGLDGHEMKVLSNFIEQISVQVLRYAWPIFKEILDRAMSFMIHSLAQKTFFGVSQKSECLSNI